MVKNPYSSRDGAAWTLGVDGANRFPTNFVGGGTATNTDSIMDLTGASALVPPATAIQFLGYTVLATGGAGGTMSIGIHNSSTIGGLSFPAESVGCFKIGGVGDGILWRNFQAHGINFCVKCSAGVTAILHWRRLA